MDSYEVEVELGVGDAREYVDPELFATAMDLIDDVFRGRLPDRVASDLSSMMSHVLVGMFAAVEEIQEKTGLKKVEIMEIKSVEKRDGALKLTVEVVSKE